MDCITFRQRLSEFLDRQLAAPELSSAESHMSDCPGCRSEFEELKGISQMVSGVGRQPLPTGFMQRLERRRQAEGQPAAAAQPGYSFLPHGMPRLAAFAISSLIVAFIIVDKTKSMMEPAQSMISGAAGNLGEAGKKFGGAPAARPALSAGGLSGLGAISGGGGGGSGASNTTAGESVNTNTLEMLRRAAGQQAAESNRGQAAKSEQFAEAKAESDSVTSTGRKLARARGEPISALRGGGGAGGSSGAAPAAMASAAAPAAAPAHQYTNEELAANIEAQKKAMGIRTIIPPGSQDNRLQLAMMAAQRGNGGDVELLQGTPDAAPLGGQTPTIISDNGGATGGAMADMDGKGATSRLDEAPGVLIRSEAERQDLWHKYQMTADAPAVDYTTQMLAVVFATSPSTSIQISRITPSQDRIVIYYHELPISKDANAPFVPAYQFRVIQKTDKPVVFEKLP